MNDNTIINEQLSLALQEIADIEEREKLEAKRQEKVRKEMELERQWCKIFIRDASQVIHTKGNIQSQDEGISPHNGRRMTSYWWDTPPVAAIIDDRQYDLILKAYPKNEYSPDTYIKCVAIIAEAVGKGQKHLFSVGEHQARSWSGKATPSQRIFAHQLLELIDSGLPTLRFR